MSLKNVSLQLARKKNAVSGNQQVKRTLSEKAFKMLKYRFSVKLMAFALKRESELANIYLAQQVTRLALTKKQFHFKMPSLQNFYIFEPKNVNASFATVLGTVIERKNIFFSNIIEELVSKKVAKRSKPQYWDPSFRIITPYGQSKKVTENFIKDIEMAIAIEKTKLKTEREQ